MEKSGVKSRRGFTHTCKQKEVEKELNEINDEQLDLFKEKYPDAKWGLDDGIVWVRTVPDEPMTAWLRERPGIIVQVDTFEEAVRKIKEVIDSIEGWDE